MPPSYPLPHDPSFSSAEDYIDSILSFVSTSDTFSILCGGVHILDFFTTDLSLFQAALPSEWQPFLLSCDTMRLLDLLVRDDLDKLEELDFEVLPPDSFLDYVRTIRKLSLARGLARRTDALPTLPRSVAIGMKPKKEHEVVHFAEYVQRLSDTIEQECGEPISHFVDFGSGQNYLGRALASEPYNKHIVAVEGRNINVAAAKELDVHSGLVVKPVVKRNKKLWMQILDACGPGGASDPIKMEAAIRKVAGDDAVDFRPIGTVESVHQVEEGKGSVQYVSGRLDSGDLTEVVENINKKDTMARDQKLNLMAVSIHSCGNLSHYGIRSLLLNSDIKAVAIVGCCYNLLTERLGPPTYKHPYLRPTLQALNGRVIRESAKFDPQGFPMSTRLATYLEHGVRLNVTARMMACQAPQNWNKADSEGFFRRHFFRAVLQRIFLDRGVVGKIRHRVAGEEEEEEEEGHDNDEPESPFNMSTNPVIIGSLRKSCYTSLKAYVRGVVEKLTTSTDFKQYAEVMREKMADITDEEIDKYEAAFEPRRREIAAIWTLMAFSATVVESLIITDRWIFLKEQGDVLKDAWVEPVFDMKESPRNMVVVGIKK